MGLLLAVWPYKGRIYRIYIKKETVSAHGQAQQVETIYIAEKELHPRSGEGNSPRPASPEV